MSAFKKLCIIITLVFLVLTGAVNILLISSQNNAKGMYRVEAKRAAEEITEKGSCDLSNYPHLTGIYPDEGDLYISDNHYVIADTAEGLYRIEYTVEDTRQGLLAVNAMMIILYIFTAAVLFYVRRNLIAPFARLNDVPKELAKGNLSVPIPEEKSRYFGRFTWGVNLLRESIEDSRKREMSMQREKKVLMLSLSHDIKTPLSAIKLNAQALSRGLYKDEERQREAAFSISKRADEIESFVKQITQAASEDFMSFDVKQGEAFLSHITEKINARYAVQLKNTGTEFIIESFSDCILSCDPDRLAECLQNLVENAIKYGDGKMIKLSFEKMDGCELITVSNTGCTLDPSEITQIFSSFHRGSNADKVQGNGLGLFICKKLMSLMNGEVYAAVENDCFNATLVVKLA